MDNKYVYENKEYTVMKISELLNELKVYHGSRNNHTGFDTQHTGINSSTFSSYTSTRYGIFFTNNPKFASLYGDVEEYDLLINNTLDLDSSHGEDLLYEFKETLSMHTDREIYLDVSNIIQGHWEKWNLFENELGKHFVKFLKNKRYDSATFKEYLTNDNGKTVKSQTYVVFNPSKAIYNGQYELDLYETKQYPYEWNEKTIIWDNTNYVGDNIMESNETYSEKIRREAKEKRINEYKEGYRYIVNFKIIDLNSTIEDSKMSKQSTPSKAKKEVREFLKNHYFSYIKTRITSVDMLTSDGEVIPDVG